MASPANCCVVCNADLPTAVKRRVIHPCNEANADAHEFFMNVVSPGYTFQSTSVRYVCRTPCFLNLEMAIKHHNALRDLLGSLRGNVAPLTPITKSSLLGFFDIVMTVHQFLKHPPQSHSKLVEKMKRYENTIW